jgi:membrane protease YdiL (CAAX protease family)
MQSYLDLAKMGRNAWWRYLLAVILILFTWQILGSLPDLALVIWSTLKGGLSGSGAMQALASTPAGFAAIMLASVFFLGGIYLAMRFIHHRRMRTLITPAPAIAWGRFFQGFGLWFVLVALMAVVEALLYPGRYVWSLDLPRLVPFVLLALIFIPIQSGTEELFFRGYILQSLGLRVRNIWVLCAFSGLAFGLPHLLNPEASINYPLFFLYYFAFGFSLAYLTLRDGRLELALGAHPPITSSRSSSPITPSACCQARPSSRSPSSTPSIPSRPGCWEC